jgi:hypothetical protein
MEFSDRSQFIDMPVVLFSQAPVTLHSIGQVRHG